MERHYEVTEQEVTTKNIFNEEDRKMVDHLIHKMVGIPDDTELDDNLRSSSLRWCRMWSFLTEGYRTDPKKYLEKCFPVDTPSLAEDYEDFDEDKTDELYKNGIITVATDARSNCMHHLQNMHGRVYVCYIPKDKVVGLSKIVRMVKMYGRRLNLQEGWNNNIADAMMSVLDCRGCLVYSDMVHECVASRGIEEQTASTVCVTVRGIFTDPKVKSEALSIINSAETRRKN